MHGVNLKNKPANSLYLLILIIIIAIFAPYLANERPLYAKYKGKQFTLHLQMRHKEIRFLMKRENLSLYYNMI